jgi:hypothetical protein
MGFVPSLSLQVYHSITAFDWKVLQPNAAGLWKRCELSTEAKIEIIDLQITAPSSQTATNISG